MIGIALGAIVLAATAQPGAEQQHTPAVVVLVGGQVLPARRVVVETGRVVIEGVHDESYVLRSDLVQIDLTNEVNIGLEAAAARCRGEGAAVPHLSSAALTVLQRVAPGLLGPCVQDALGAAVPSPPTRTPPVAPTVSPLPTRPPAATPTPDRLESAASPAATPPARQRVTRLATTQGDLVPLSDSPDLWDTDHIVARVPGGTPVRVLEEVDLPVDEWAVVRFRVKVIAGEHAGAEGWVFYQDVEGVE